LSFLSVPRWITWAAEPDPARPGKTIKRPTHWQSGIYCNPLDPANQTSYEQVKATGKPTGFVFDAEDKLFFIDIDGAYDGAAWSPLALDICARFPDAFVEVSQSGKGLHIIGRYAGDAPAHRNRNTKLGLELYTHDRFCAVTFASQRGDSFTDCTAALVALVSVYFTPATEAPGERAGWTNAPVSEWTGPDDDATLISMALASGKRSATARFGGVSVDFEALWTADADALGSKWPSSSGGAFDGSSADAALASHLSFWTGKNCERIRDLMSQSALVRQKWIDRPGYLDDTVLASVATTANVYARAPAVASGAPAVASGAPAVASGAPVAIARPGSSYCDVATQLALFAGCVYIASVNKIWVRSSGLMLDKPRFDVMFGGRSFRLLSLDDTKGTMTKSAWEAFTLNQNYASPYADDFCFRP
jgi:primase-polymerase (primpol)-like protein